MAIVEPSRTRPIPSASAPAPKGKGKGKGKRAEKRARFDKLAKAVDRRKLGASIKLDASARTACFALLMSAVDARLGRIIGAAFGLDKLNVSPKRLALALRGDDVKRKAESALADWDKRWSATVGQREGLKSETIERHKVEVETLGAAIKAGQIERIGKAIDQLVRSGSTSGSIDRGGSGDRIPVTLSGLVVRLVDTDFTARQTSERFRFAD